MKLEGRVAVVTGGGRGIGSAICRAFAAEGACVAILDIDETGACRLADQIGAEGIGAVSIGVGSTGVASSGPARATAWAVDVTDADAVERAASEIEVRLGPIEVWVNNAGVSKIVPFLECTEELWDAIIRVNLKGTFNGCKAAIARMLPRRRGVIINMSSQSGKQGTSRYQAYCASKFAVIGLTQSLAVEFAGASIRVNALCPGFVHTPLWDEQLPAYAAKKGIAADKVLPYLEERVPLGRLCSPEEVARAAVFLAGDEASYITGEALNLSGGALMD
jgi:NAD(P)-dependent dehydrogenase (short-subunit alcohol dehydrogenase family)